MTRVVSSVTASSCGGTLPAGVTCPSYMSSVVAPEHEASLKTVTPRDAAVSEG
ncbi:hypothetical protein ACFQGX_06700 [Nonomuraea dietziae]|uniref:hypothetical protein n=1 Tax=Nonomuraea dietziae TaxID=65515 RepID=UPI00360F97AE